MQDVVIKAGVYGRRDEKGRVLPVAKGERVTLADEEAARLVALDVAVYADAPTEAPSVPPAPPPGGGEPEGGHQDTTGTGAPAEAPTGGEEGGSDEPDAEVARLERMQKVDLEQMAADMGLDVSGARTKHDLAVLIVATGAADDSDDLPDLGARGIVT